MRSSVNLTVIGTLPMQNPPSPPESSTSSTPDHKAASTDWSAIERDTDFIALLRSKMAFVVPATLFFVVYYFALPIAVGWFPKVMETKVLGDVNLAYLFALSQFFMAWILAFAYVAVAAGWDRRAEAIISKFHKEAK
jgi:uncharacterized membrane protein (DUF485 family)